MKGVCALAATGRSEVASVCRGYECRVVKVGGSARGSKSRVTMSGDVPAEALQEVVSALAAEGIVVESSAASDEAGAGTTGDLAPFLAHQQPVLRATRRASPFAAALIDLHRKCLARMQHDGVPRTFGTENSTALQ
ncbi:hypothetical protein HaLaN_07456 [Haematococcus lacustris]|uniref:Uncharacterized protein n=1 Tax=Haematococcus lacustris TaxID=44745 RepID=A0A699YZ46_HAELA|nr:hypothetical protein HaLaN_07456 [Haematococcus lacustris]